MSKPTIRKITPFPATEKHLLKFDMSGSGSQVVYNEVEIRKNSTNETVFLNRIQEFRYQHLIGYGTNLTNLSTTDYIVYSIPAEVELTRDYQIYKDENMISTGYTVDETARTVTFDTSLKEDISENLTHKSNYKSFQFSQKADENHPFSVFIDGVESTTYTIDYINKSVNFDNTLLETIREPLTYNSTDKSYSYEYSKDDSQDEKIYVDGNLISSGYQIDDANKKILLYQSVTRESATPNADFSSYTVSKEILNNSSAEVYIDNQLVEDGYTIDYANKKINFFFSPYPLDKNSEVEVTYKTPFVPSDTVEMEYSFFNKVVSATYSRLVPKISINQNYFTNGIQYYAIIRVYDVNEVLISESDPEFFYCFSLPSLKINEIDSGQTDSQTVTFNGSYSQAEGEEIQSYIFKLYDSNKLLLAQSDEIFSDTISYEFTNLENKTQYYIELKVLTINDMEHSTGLLSFTPSYIAPRFASAIELTNNKQEASVNVDCNVIRIIGVPINEPVDFLDSGEVDITDNEIYFDRGFSLEGDFTLQLYARDIVEKSIFLEIKSKSGVSLKLHRIGNRISLFKTTKDDMLIQYLFNDLSLDLATDKTLFISLKQVRGLYDMYTEVLG